MSSGNPINNPPGNPLPPGLTVTQSAPAGYAVVVRRPGGGTAMSFTVPNEVLGETAGAVLPDYAERAQVVATLKEALSFLGNPVRDL